MSGDVIIIVTVVHSLHRHGGQQCWHQCPVAGVLRLSCTA